MGLIPQDVVDQVVDRCDIVEIISGYLPLKKAGKNYRALSPFTNEKTPSFFVSPEKQIFHCFSSGVGGNVVSFIMKFEHMEFPEAIRFLADKVGIEITASAPTDSKSKDLKKALHQANELAVEFFHQTLLTDKDPAVQEARKYLKKRGVSLDIVQKFKLGFAKDQWDSLLLALRKQEVSLGLIEKAGLIIEKEKRDGFYDRFRNRIIFPIFDIKKKCLGFGGRAMAEEMAKYVNSPETPIYTKGEHLFGLHMAKDSIARKDFVIVTEGYMDFIMPFQAGVENIVASLGTALTTKQIRLLRRYTRNVVMLFDTDQAGESAMVRSLDLLIEESMNVKVASLTQGEDPDSFIRKFGVEEFDKRIDQAKTLFDYKLKTLTNEHGSNTVEGRAKICGEMFPTINKFDNAVLKSEYLKRLSQALSVSYEALAIELKKVSDFAKKRGGHSKQEKPKPVETKTRVVEQRLLRLMLEDEDLIPQTKEEVRLDDFRNGKIREIISKIYELYADGKEVNPTNLMNCFNSEQTQAIISKLMVDEEAFNGDKKKMHMDCVDRMINDRLRSQRQELLQQIRQAEIDGDHDKVDELKIQFNELIKGLV